MTGAAFASTYLDPPSGLLATPKTAVKDNASGWPKYYRFHRGWAADALRRARRNAGMGMTDAQAVAAIPAYLTRRLTQAAAVKDSSGAFIAPNILTDFQGLTSLQPVAPTDYEF